MNPQMLNARMLHPRRLVHAAGVLLAGVLLVVAGTSRCAAAERAGLAGHTLRRHALPWHSVLIPDCLGKRCCDDYHAKPLPPVGKVKACGCDDYCPKSLPCPAIVHRYQCDDYRPKPLPSRCCSPPLDLTCPQPLPRCPTATRLAPVGSRSAAARD